MSIFLKKFLNIGRQEEIDLLRGFTALNIIVCHVGLYLGGDNNTILWTFCDICGSEFAAPVFMVLMGISSIYSTKQKPKEQLKRGLNLFVLGYALSFVRSLLPLLLFGNVDEWTCIEAFLVVDILQFAGLSFMLIALLRKFKLTSLKIFIVSVVMVVVNQFIMFPKDFSLTNKLLIGIINLFCPVTEWSCFPLLTWFIFPAFGLVFGELLIHCTNKKKLYAALLPLGLCGIVYVYYQFYLLYPDYTRYYWGHNFYYMGLKNSLFTLLFVLFALAFWFFVRKVIPDLLRKSLCFLSKNINIYYLISWVLISLLMHMQAMFNLSFNTLMTIGLMIIVMVLSALFTKLCLWLKESFRSKAI